MGAFPKPPTTFSLPTTFNAPVKMPGGLDIEPTAAGVVGLTVKPTTGDAVTAGVVIQATAVTALAQQLMEIFDHLNNPIAGWPIAGGPAVFGDNAIRASNSVFGPFSGILEQGTGANNEYFLALGDQGGVIRQVLFLNGVPGTVNNRTVAIGDIAFNAAGGAGTTLYQCTVAGTPGTWVARA